MEKFHEIQRCVDDVEKDSTKFFHSNNKAAGTRARKHLQTLKTLAQELRVQIQDSKAEKQQHRGEDLEQEQVEQGYEEHYEE
mmetsp:Transcript_29337/g.71407  ORF Transcript_29337/g.71407 Transcript_29337/m.71407 type:complete len:82 (-) Transcript_29337:220-465(-)|eukprot:CAMPEP_0198310146 /NCGR_PEP_ID=MMETSP1450-20131203/2311_1 /TAXON_ID=753684 ORGANISM="Madagascaria erythrocladiodes, Strain CCMP3234" /NCGR_SAMPLE_ID=MMETSP1450 /ASSEMBLY_ACC=CAM_ASM_001115 /LENGTH=81 /DNA_ID=CAMNT_0044012951 /DNA_START=143 /DNA_END=388 /DNA_ORIENTATION=-